VVNESVRNAGVRFQQLEKRRLEDRPLTRRHPELWVVGERDDRVSVIDVVVDARVVSSITLRQRSVQPLGHVVSHTAVRWVSNEQYLRHPSPHQQPEESSTHNSAVTHADNVSVCLVTLTFDLLTPK